MKTITAHLLEYTLMNHIENNRSELARKLGIRRTDFNRIYDRCMQGEGGSRTTIEALLRLYCNEGYSMDEALSCYSESNAKSSDNERQFCEERSRQMRLQMSNESKRADQRAQVMRSAEQMLMQIERAFCSRGCNGQESCAKDCPCQRFAEFIAWLQKKLDAVPVSEEG